MHDRFGCLVTHLNQLAVLISDWSQLTGHGTVVITAVPYRFYETFLHIYGGMSHKIVKIRESTNVQVETVGIIIIHERSLCSQI